MTDVSSQLASSISHSTFDDEALLNPANITKCMKPPQPSPVTFLVQACLTWHEPTRRTWQVICHIIISMACDLDSSGGWCRSISHDNFVIPYITHRGNNACTSAQDHLEDREMTRGVLHDDNSVMSLEAESVDNENQSRPITKLDLCCRYWIAC